MKHQSNSSRRIKRNKYLLSVDIEGVSGVSQDSFARHGQKDYDLGKKYMAHDTNAVIEGILKYDPESEILVRDAHGSSTNLNLIDLHPKASLIQGWGISLNMMEGLDSSFKAAFLIGYHAGGHNDQGVLAHTMLGSFARISVNNIPINETGISAIYSEIYKVPVVFLSGDDQACLEARAQIRSIEVVEVKKSIARDCTLSLPLEKSAKLICDGAFTALEKLSRIKNKSGLSVFFLQTHAPYQVVIDISKNTYSPSLFAHLSSVLKHECGFFVLPKKYQVCFSAKDPLDFSRKLVFLIHLVAGVRAMQKND